MRNRIKGETWKIEQGHAGPFTDVEALVLQMSYETDPSAVECPTCGPDQIEVVAYIEPQLLGDGWATVTPPVGVYAPVIYCRGCRKMIGITVRDPLPEGAR